GVWPYVSFWNWAVATGVHDGTTVAVNMGGKWTTGTGVNENGILLGGRLHKVMEDLVWTYDPADWMKPWRVVSPHTGMIDLTLAPVVARSSRISVGFLRSGGVCCFGTWEGRVRVEGGEVELRSVPGWAEEFDHRWCRSLPLLQVRVATGVDLLQPAGDEHQTARELSGRLVGPDLDRDALDAVVRVGEAGVENALRSHAPQRRPTELEDLLHRSPVADELPLALHVGARRRRDAEAGRGDREREERAQHARRMPTAPVRGKRAAGAAAATRGRGSRPWCCRARPRARAHSRGCRRRAASRVARRAGRRRRGSRRRARGASSRAGAPGTRRRAAARRRPRDAAHAGAPASSRGPRGAAGSPGARGRAAPCRTRRGRPPR